MPEIMTRGKNQVLFRYLPEQTIDFSKGMAIARITEIHGMRPPDISHNAVLQRVGLEIRAWNEQNRPRLTDSILLDTSRFDLIDPREVQCELFPKVFWCQNRYCGRVHDFTRSNRLPSATCPACQASWLVQLRFVKIHRCGNLEPLTPPSCARCNSGRGRMALDTRGSERVSSFRWICRNCLTTQQVIAGVCPHCTGTDRKMEIQVHRAGKTFYPYATTLLNVPDKELDALMNRDVSMWAPVVAAKFLRLPEVSDFRLLDLARTLLTQESAGGSSVPVEELTQLTERLQSGKIEVDQMIRELNVLKSRAEHRSGLVDPIELMTSIAERSGIESNVWVSSVYPLMESLLPSETAFTTCITSLSADSPERLLARDMGILDIELVSDFPIVTATYGFSRSEHGPNNAYLNPFPGTQNSGNKHPVFVDRIQADAIRIRLNPHTVLEWIDASGSATRLPSGTDGNLARIGYFVRLASDANLFSTIGRDLVELRMAFGLLHTLSHLAVKQAALLCGLERTSLSEYVLPCSLEFFLYSNHRGGRTIGALTALFEQTLREWLMSIIDARDCVYDPVCKEHGSACHACAHLAETSCRFFNLNLSRSFLFGGNDQILDRPVEGYFDFARERNGGALRS